MLAIGLSEVSRVPETDPSAKNAGQEPEEPPVDAQEAPLDRRTAIKAAGLRERLQASQAEERKKNVAKR